MPRLSCALPLLALLSCASRSTPPSRPPDAPPIVGLHAPPPSARLTRASLRVLTAAAVDGGAPALLLTLADDGALVAEGRPYAQMQGDAVVRADGRPLLRLSDATLTIDGARDARLDGDDVVSEDGVRMRVEDDGRVSFASTRGQQFAPVRIEGVTPATRLTATVLVLLEMVRERAR